MAEKKAPVGDRIFIANESFSLSYGGSDHAFVKDQTRVREGHPILVGREHLFKPVSAHYEFESATQAPGERRA